MSSYQSSHKVDTVSNRQLGANIFERTVFINSVTQISGTTYYEAFVEVDLAELNLNTLVPEFSVVMYSYTRVSGPNPGEFIYYNEHKPLPFSTPKTTGTTAQFGLISESAIPYIYYESSGGVKDGVENGTSKLVIHYVIKDYSGTGISKRFDIKIKGSDAITAD